MNLTTFDFRESAVRVLVREGAPWFVAADVCRVLEIANSRDAIAALDEDEKMTVGNADGHSGKRGGAQSFNVISESGLYALVFKSRKPEAKAFRKWVTSEVLPAIRETGGYQTGSAGDVETGREPEMVSLWRYLRLVCPGWTLDRQMEFGLLARRYMKSMGIVFQTAVEPEAGRVFVFPRSVLESLRLQHTRTSCLPDSEAVEFERLLESVHATQGDCTLEPEVLRGMAKMMRLFPRIFGPNTSVASERSGFGKLCARFDGLTFPSGLRLQVRVRSSSANRYEIERVLKPELALGLSQSPRLPVSTSETHLAA